MSFLLTCLFSARSKILHRYVPVFTTCKKPKTVWDIMHFYVVRMSLAFFILAFEVIAICFILAHSYSPQIFSYSSLLHLSQRQICIPCKYPVFLCPINTLTIFGSSSQYLPHDTHEPILFAPSWSARYSTLIIPAHHPLPRSTDKIYAV